MKYGIKRKFFTTFLLVMAVTVFTLCDFGGGVALADVEITTTSKYLDSGTVGNSYSFKMGVTGAGTTGEFGKYLGTTTITSGNLPNGLYVSDSQGYWDIGNPGSFIKGTPVKSGTFTFTLRIEYNGSADEREFKITIQANPNIKKPSIGSTLPSGIVGVPYDHELLGSKGDSSTYTWDHDDNLPDGLDFDVGSNSSHYRLHGTPEKAGTYTFKVTLADKYEPENGKDEKSFTVKIYSPDDPEIKPEITGSFKVGEIDKSYSSYVEASNGTEPYTWDYDGDLPDGLDFSASGTKYTLSGTPTESGKFQIQVTVRDKNNISTTKDFEIEITPKRTEPVISGALTTTGTVGESYSSSLTATSGTEPYVWSHTGNLPDGLTFSDSDGTYTLSGTLTAPGTYDFTVNLTDAYFTVTKDFSITVNDSLPEISGTLEATGNVDTAYSSSLTATGGHALYEWSYTGDLPDGLDFSYNGDTYTLSGTPTTEGTYNFTVELTDAYHDTPVTKAFTIEIKPEALHIVFPLEDGYAYNTYNHRIGAYGGTGPYVWSWSGTLPKGLDFEYAFSETDPIWSRWYKLWGIPEETGEFTVTVTVKDATGTQVSETMTFKISKSEDELASYWFFNNGTLNVDYISQISAYGGTGPYTWSYQGTLPKGLELEQISTGVWYYLYGTPEEAGEFAVRVTVTDSEGEQVNRTLAFIISDDSEAYGGDFYIRGTYFDVLDNGAIDQYYRSSVSTYEYDEDSDSVVKHEDGPYEWSYTGTLPTGLEFNVDDYDDSICELSGQPQEVGTFTFTLTATDANGKQAYRTFTVLINDIDHGPLPEISGDLTATGTVGTSYSSSLKAIKGATSYEWSYTGDLPTGLYFSSLGDTYTLSGTPTTPGTYKFTVELKDTYYTVTKDCSIVISDIVHPDPVISGTLTATGKLGDEYSSALTATEGTAPYTWNWTGTLPDGLTFLANGEKYTLAGTPTKVGTFEFTVGLTDLYHSTPVTKTFKVIIDEYPKPVISGTLGAGTVSTSYSSALKATNGTTPYEWSYTGTLPTGLSFSVLGDTYTLSGTPTTKATYTFTVNLKDAHYTVSKDYSVEISNVVHPKPEISGTLTATGKLGTSYSSSLTVAKGTAPYTWTYSGILPDGLKFSANGNTYTLSGTPSKAGTWEITVGLADTYNSTPVTKSFKVTIEEPVYPEPVISGTLTTTGKINTAYSSSITATGGTSPYSWSYTGDLPKGLAFSANGEKYTLSGTPTEAKTYGFMVKLSDAHHEVVKLCSITINDTSSSTITIENHFTDGTVNVPYSGFLQAEGASAFEWTFKEGTLPEGLGLEIDENLSKYLILKGTPSKAGSYEFKIQAKDKNSSNFRETSFTVNIYEPLDIADAFNNGSMNTSYSSSVKVTGGINLKTGNSYIWRNYSGTLPDGLSLSYDKDIATLSGTPSKTGDYKFQLGVSIIWPYAGEAQISTLSADFLVKIVDAGKTIPAITILSNSKNITNYNANVNIYNISETTKNEINTINNISSNTQINTDSHNTTDDHSTTNTTTNNYNSTENDNKSLLGGVGLGGGGGCNAGFGLLGLMFFGVALSLKRSK